MNGLTREQLLLGGATALMPLGYLTAVAAPAVLRAASSFGCLALGTLGRTGRNDAIRIGGMLLKDDARRMHTHIVGATGSGKTVCIEHLLFADIKRGLGALIIDPKGEREFYERVRAYARKIGREADLILLSATYPEESALWNPCGLGGVSELQTKFFNSAIYNEPHYAKACEAALLRAFGSLVEQHADGFAIAHLVDELQAIAKETKEKNIEGLFYDLYNLANGEWGEVLGCQGVGGGQPLTLSFLDVVQQGKILFVDLPTEGKLVQSSRIGRLITQEIILLSGMRKRHPELKTPKPFSVFIDEFDAFGTESFISFLNKGRSSGFLITLAHQTLSDLQKISATFEGQVLGNTNVRFTFRLNDPKDCETSAKLYGTKRVIKRTYQTHNDFTTGASSNREVQEFKIHPDVIKEQKTGQCVFFVKSQNLLRRVKVPKPVKLELSRERLGTHGAITRGTGIPLVPKPTRMADELPTSPVDAPPAPPTLNDQYAAWGAVSPKKNHKQGDVA